MKILGREELWIHTHFLTDCTRLPEFRMREILKEMGPFLRESGIAFGLCTSRRHKTNGLVASCWSVSLLPRRLSAFTTGCRRSSAIFLLVQR